MVGDDEVEAAAGSGVGGGESANAGIDTDDQVNAAIGSLFDHLVAHAVTFANAMRHMIVDFAAAQLKGCFQDDDSRRAVDVVVAIDKHGLAALNGGLQAFDGRAQAGHQIGRVQITQSRVKEFLCLLAGMDAAHSQQPR